MQENHTKRMSHNKDKGDWTPNCEDDGSWMPNH